MNRAAALRSAAAVALAIVTGAAATPPVFGPRWVISTDDYPSEARQKGQTGTVRYEVAVAASGKPTGCSIIKSSGHAALDETTCNLVMKRARFLPARDDAGNAVPGTLRLKLTWDPVPAAMEPAYAGYSVNVSFDATGAVTDCKVTPIVERTPLSAAQARLCDRMGTAEAFSDMLGRPTAGLSSARFRYWLKETRFGGQLPTDQPIRRLLLQVSFDATADGASSWCEVVQAPLTRVAGLSDVDWCGPKAFGVTRPGGGFANDLFVDVVASEDKRR